MNRKVLWAINFLVLALLAVSITISYRYLNPSESLMLSCSSELFDRRDNANAEGRHYLLVDIMAKQQQAQINYRYFNLDGTSAGTIRMQGKYFEIDKHSGRYHFSVETKEESGAESTEAMPRHMQYLSYISSFNLDSKGMHNLSIEPLELDPHRDYAVVLFQPSNTVCGCRIVQ
ncbi:MULTISPECIES: hypothetical protein [Shewanella]|uniref:Uncharacterized protein n=1 Tax=Shewanella marisflavi TaxID=260364 RepID=A0AAC9TYE4_9GAMM|nr:MULTISPECIES: hypothetical protein [Shewanella]ASJ95764.1 hypothetical protein CFF01_03680 [Shewanella marisflavi]MCL1041750.1 hypothetical protein [Shewanella marisflavi]QDF74326.1 hypothetical protein FGA12_03600 [Shewanella marisflavi]